MKKISFVFACLGIVLGLAAPARGVESNFHSFVSPQGSLGAACTFAAPCKDMNDAVSTTFSGGVVSCADQGGSSGGSTIQLLSITKSITIDCAGTANATWWITINGSGIVVTLRHLIVTAASGGSAHSIGIDFQNGAALFVEHCLIEHFETSPGYGINFAPTSGTAQLQVTDSVIKNNSTASSGAGINVAPGSGGSARVTLRRVEIDDNYNGLNVDTTASSATTRVIVSDSSMTGNTNNGINLATSGPVDMTVERSVLSNNLRGIKSLGASATVRIGNSTITGNGAGVQNLGGVMTSYKNNIITGNGQNGTPLQAATDD